MLVLKGPETKALFDTISYNLLEQSQDLVAMFIQLAKPGFGGGLVVTTAPPPLLAEDQVVLEVVQQVVAGHERRSPT